MVYILFSFSSGREGDERCPIPPTPSSSLTTDPRPPHYPPVGVNGHYGPSPPPSSLGSPPSPIVPAHDRKSMLKGWVRPRLRAEYRWANGFQVMCRVPFCSTQSPKERRRRSTPLAPSVAATNSSFSGFHVPSFHSIRTWTPTKDPIRRESSHTESKASRKKGSPFLPGRGQGH
jgi:hypothetical protein